MNHPELASIKSLAMMKMEKNFRAQDKGYVRMPPDSNTINELAEWVHREYLELMDAVFDGDCVHIREEIADVANCLDYLYEKVLRGEETK
jgi:hypothetical protein